MKLRRARPARRPSTGRRWQHASSRTGVDGRRVVEPGRITLSTGPSAADRGPRPI